MTTNEFERLERDLEAAFAVDVPEMAFEAPQSERTVTHRRFAWRVGAVTGIAAAAVLGAVLVAPNFGGDGPKVASAEELIQRSIAASDALAASPENYHLITVARTGDSEIWSETWSGGPNRYRTEGRSVADGAVHIQGSAMLNGEMWVYQGPEGSLTAAHGPAFLEVLTPVPAVSLEQLLASWTETGCFQAEVTGRETIAGREAHVVTVLPADNCATPRKPLQRAMLWIDVENDFTLKSTYESTTGESTSTLEVVQFDTFTELGDDAFAYAPPPGAQVTEFSDSAGLKRALAGAVIVPRGSRVIILSDWTVPANEEPK